MHSGRSWYKYSLESGAASDGGAFNASNYWDVLREEIWILSVNEFPAVHVRHLQLRNWMDRWSPPLLCCLSPRSFQLERPEVAKQKDPRLIQHITNRIASPAFLTLRRTVAFGLARARALANALAIVIALALDLRTAELTLSAIELRFRAVELALSDYLFIFQHFFSFVCWCFAFKCVYPFHHGFGLKL